MQNKRGISQAFSAQQPAAELLVRPATVFDVFDMSEVLIASITQLYGADHANPDPDLAHWTADKTPASIRDWIVKGCVPSLAVIQGRISGVGQITPTGEISLLHIAPWIKDCGPGRALLLHLETELVMQGHSYAHLNAPQSRLDFYRSQGWKVSEGGINCFGLPGQSMRKVLQAEC